MKTTACLLVCLACSAALAATPAEDKARKEAMRKTAAAVVAEVDQYGYGDWTTWHRQLVSFRAELRSRIQAAEARLPAFQKSHAAPSPLFHVDGHPTLFEWPSDVLYLAAKAEQPDPETWANSRPAMGAIKAVSRWLRQMQIDLIVVPVPKMAEVYANQLGAGQAPGGIGAPHMRRMILDLLRADVEVVDLLPIFLKERDADSSQLYLRTDGHWSDRAQQLAATEIASRLGRYSFIQTAEAKPAQFQTTPVEVAFNGAEFERLNTAEVEAVKQYVAHTKVTKVTAGGAPFKEPEDSPLVVIGDSYTHYFQLVVCPGSGIDALISHAVNIPVSNVSSAGATTNPIKDFLRNPALLRNCKVVIWITTNSMVSLDSGWDLPKLPEGFLKK